MTKVKKCWQYEIIFGFTVLAGMWIMVDLQRQKPVAPVVNNTRQIDSLTTAFQKYKNALNEVDSDQKIQIGYLEGQLGVERNKVVRLQKELDECDDAKNYHVITVWH